MNINTLEEFEKVLKKFNFFNAAQIDENSVKCCDPSKFEITLLSPLTDLPKNCKVYDKFLCFSLEKHAYISVHLKFNNIKSSDILLNKDEHDDPIYIKNISIDPKEKSIHFAFEYCSEKYIKLHYSDFDITIHYDKDKKIYAHKRLRVRLAQSIKKYFKRK